MISIFKKKGIIVSCQAYPGDPLYGDFVMAHMAKAAEMGGAVGIRANGAKDIREIKAVVGIPVIGLNKRHVPGSDVYITPEWQDAKDLLEAGAAVIAMDVTNRECRVEAARELIRAVHTWGAVVMADISTLEEGLIAEDLGVDMVSTTLSGYTPYSKQQEAPDLELVARLSERLRIPVIAEGRIGSPDQAVRAFEAGASWIVVGSAITRPEMITNTYTSEAKRYE